MPSDTVSTSGAWRRKSTASAEAHILEFRVGRMQKDPARISDLLRDTNRIRAKVTGINLPPESKRVLEDSLDESKKALEEQARKRAKERSDTSYIS